MRNAIKIMRLILHVINNLSIQTGFNTKLSTMKLF